MTHDELQGFTEAAGQALDAEVLRHPGVTTLELCGVLGAMAGAAVALSLPSSTAEVDEIHLDAMAHAYRSTLLGLLVQAREAGVNGSPSDRLI